MGGGIFRNKFFPANVYIKNINIVKKSIQFTYIMIISCTERETVPEMKKQMKRNRFMLTYYSGHELYLKFFLGNHQRQATRRPVSLKIIVINEVK